VWWTTVVWKVRQLRQEKPFDSLDNGHHEEGRKCHTDSHENNSLDGRDNCGNDDGNCNVHDWIHNRLKSLRCRKLFHVLQRVGHLDEAKQLLVQLLPLLMLRKHAPYCSLPSFYCMALCMRAKSAVHQRRLAQLHVSGKVATGEVAQPQRRLPILLIDGQKSELALPLRNKIMHAALLVLARWVDEDSGCVQVGIRRFSGECCAQLSVLRHQVLMTVRRMRVKQAVVAHKPR
jgi:hypothetical protein